MTLQATASAAPAPRERASTRYAFEARDLPRDEPLLLYGTGPMARAAIDALTEHRVIGVVGEGVGSRIASRPVVPEARLPRLVEKGARVVVARTDHVAVERRLRALGTPADWILLPGRLETTGQLQYLTIEVTTRCNLRCFGCMRTIEKTRDNWSDLTMSLEDFRRVVENLPPVAAATLHGIGEPTLNPALPEMVSIAASSGKFGELTICTNGITRTPEYLIDLCDRGLDYITVSVDSLVPATAEACRAGTRVAKLRSTLQALGAAGVSTTVNVVVSKINLAEIESLLVELGAMGRFRVCLQPFQDHGEATGCLDAGELERLHDTVEKTRPKQPRLEIIVRNDFSFQPGEQLCKAPWSSPAVTVDGKLAPCCVGFRDNPFSSLSLVQSHYRDLWYTPTHQRFLRSYMERDPGLCEGCTMNPRAPEAQALRTAEAEQARAKAQTLGLAGVRVGVRGLRADLGHCHVVGLTDDERFEYLSLFEDGVQLGPRTDDHSVIRQWGGGAYCIWKTPGQGYTLLMSSSDNTSPLTNGRRYELVYMPASASAGR